MLRSGRVLNHCANHEWLRIASGGQLYGMGRLRTPTYVYTIIVVERGVNGYHS